MRTVWSGMLFGGAIFCAGLGDAHAEVVNEQFRFAADIIDQYEWDGSYNGYGSPNYVSTGVNDSFDVSGGFGVVPLARSGWGGTPFDFPIPRQAFTVGGDAYERADGGVYARLSVAASPGTVYDIADEPAVYASMAFTLTTAMSFELTAHAFGYLDPYGTSALFLTEIGGGTLYEFSGPATPSLFASGILGPGEYRLEVSGTGSALADVSLLVFVPAPGAAGLLGIGALLACRRRR